MEQACCSDSRGLTHTCILLHYCTDGCVSIFLTACSVRWIFESQMSMNSSTEILDLIRGGWVNGGGKGVALCLNYCPRAASPAASLFLTVTPSCRQRSVISPLSERALLSLFYTYFFSYMFFPFLYLSALFKDIKKVFFAKLNWIYARGTVGPAVNNWTSFCHSQK